MSGDPVFTFVYLILAGLVIGVLIAAPVGPVNVVCIQRTLERGFWGGFAAGIGAVLADGLIATVAAFGITAISGVMADHKHKIKFIGAAVMIGFGLRLLLKEPKVIVTARNNITRLRRMVELLPGFLRPTLRLSVWRLAPHAAIIPQTFFLTITNLGAILGLFAIIGGLGSMVNGVENTSHALTLVAAIMTGSLLWWAGLSRLISRVRHKLNHGRLRMINQGAGLLLLIFGGVLLVQFSAGLIDYYQTRASLAP
ncbi:MAG: LysE family transporter [Hyphomicrobiales bacterium]|nr:LysE family transporter [Hyphomicrobiales bacterium]